MQYRYESRWRSRHNRDFSFVWAEDLLQCVEVGEGRDWKSCPKVGEEEEKGARTEFCPAVLLEDKFVVGERMVCEDKEDEFEVYNDHVIAKWKVD
jgi:hypothetical protein